MCNACFLAVLPPTVTIQLVVTSLALLYGQRLLFPKSTSYKWARRITLVFTALVSLILFALGTFLLVLFLNEDLRSRGFANLCVSQNLRASPLDDHRCGILHKGNTMGRVLEIGPGPGTNFKCFQENDNSSIVISSSGIESYVAVEPNPFFEEEMRKEHAKRGLSFPLDIAVIKGEEIDVPSESFDVVVLTHVLCSVNSVDTVLSNAERAVKPGGRIIFMEHVIAPDGTTTRFVQRIVEPMLTILGNCHFRNLRREFEERYSGSGLFDLTMLENFEAPMPKPMAFVRPHIKGVITKKGN